MKKLYGYSGKRLVVDLSGEKTRTEASSEAFYQKYIGGNGVGTRLLYDYTKPKIDPFSPENALIFAIGPFCGTPVPTGDKYVVHAKSPLTGFVGEAVSSGFWGSALRRAGYDALVILGKAKKPSYLFIDDDIVEIRDAQHLWGKDCWETEEIIRETLGDYDIRVAAIGQAGENLVRFACITNDRNRQAGRTGMGAVMGSKLLKAVAVRGSKTVQVAKLDELLDVCKRLYEISKGPDHAAGRLRGTTGLWTHYLGALGVKNFQRGTWDEPRIAGDIRNMSESQEYLNENFIHKPISCGVCPRSCDHVDFIKDGPYKGTTSAVEYETCYSLGAMAGILYYPAVVKANEICDRLGMDTISAGVTVSWAMECFEKGIFTLEDTGGIDLKFGNAEAQIATLQKIARREGLGNLLAEGSKIASEKTGKGSEHFAIHSKGLEYPGYDTRGAKATGLAFAVSNRGACHLRGQVYSRELRGVIDRFKVEKGRGEFVADLENLQSIYDSLILCKFIAGMFKQGTPQDKYQDQYAELANIYVLVTGIAMTAEELRAAGERIWNLEKAYNVREGWTRKDDSLPPRMLKDPIVDLVSKGYVMTESELNFLLDDYYSTRGWTDKGLQKKQKLTELGLEDIAKEVGV